MKHVELLVYITDFLINIVELVQTMWPFLVPTC